jgi:hypothetical protein
MFRLLMGFPGKQLPPARGGNMEISMFLDGVFEW